MIRRGSLTSLIRTGRILLAAAGLLLGYEQGQAQFVYMNNETAPNAVSLFQVGPDGTLTPMSGTPFPTGDSGKQIRTFDGFSNASIQVKNNFLFVCNALGNSVSVLAINPDGSLRAVQGSPFASGGRFPVAVIANPQGTLLFVSNYDTYRLGVFTIAANGALAPVPGSPFTLLPLQGPTSLAINSTGTLLLISGENKLGVYHIGSGGQVTAVGDPVATGLTARALVMTSNDRFVYLAAGSGIAGFRLSPEGQLTPLPGSPFRASPSGGAFGLAVNPTGNLLAATAPGEAGVYLYRIDSNGILRPTAGSPFPTGGRDLRPISIDPDGTFVFAADVMSHTIHVWRIHSSFLRTTLMEVPASPFDLGNSGARPSGIVVK